MRILFYSTALFTLIIGCATTTTDLLPPADHLLPPEFRVDNEQDRAQVDYYLLKLAETNKGRNSIWWINYRRGLLWKDENPQLACEKFSDLARDPIFPANKIAQLRALETCPKSSPYLENIPPLKTDSFDLWLRPLALDITLNRAIRDQDKKQIMELSFEKSKQNLPQEQKTQLMQAALKLAEELGEKEKIKSFRPRLYQISPKLNPKPDVKDYLDVAYDFRKARDFDKALLYYNKILQTKSSNFNDRKAAMNGVRITLKNQRRLDDSLLATEQLAQFIEKTYKKNKKAKANQKLFLENYLNLARTQWTNGHVTKAQETLIKIEQELKGKVSLAEVYWIRGRMEEEKLKYENSLEWFDKALAEKQIDDELKEKLLWYKAWNQRKTKQVALSIESFAQLKALTINDFAKSRYMYWLARGLKETGQQDLAQTELNQLISFDPLGYYGLLAHRELKINIPAPTIQNQIAKSDSSQIAKHFSEVTNKELLDWLVALNETSAAQEYLDFVSNQYKKRAEQEQETWITFFKYYARSGSYLSLYSKLGELPSERRNQILDAHPELLFPKPWYEQVKASAESQKVKLELIYSIMRQESAFNPRARSPADAFGLMQILPEVAKNRANIIKVKFDQPEDLFEPSLNILLGAAHLRELLDRYNGQFILAVAAYNASHLAINNWMQTRFHGDTVEFIEDIPYEETRNYIRLVLRNMIFYNLLEANWKPIAFPEWALELKPL